MQQFFNYPFRTTVLVLVLILTTQINACAKSKEKLEGSYSCITNQFTPTDSIIWVDLFEHGTARFYQKGFVGLIDTNGTIICPAKYHQVHSLSDNVWSVQTQYKVGLIDQLGKFIHKQTLLGIEDLNESLLAVTEEYGAGYSLFSTKDQQIVSKQKFNYIGSFTNGIACYKKGNDYGILKANGKSIRIIKDYKDKTSQRIIRESGNGIKLYLGNEYICHLFKFQNDRAVMYQKQARNYLFGCINSQGKLKIPYEFERIHPFQFEKAPARKKGKWGLIGLNGETLIPFKYDSLSRLSPKRFKVWSKGRKGLLDEKGTTIIPIEYDSIIAIPSSISKYIVSKGGKAGTISEHKEKGLAQKYPSLKYLNQGLFITQNKKHWGLIDSVGRQVLPYKYDAIATVSDTLGIAVEFQGTFPLNTGIPRYNYSGTFFFFNRHGKRISEKFKFTKTIEYYSDYHDSKTVIHKGPNFFLPDLFNQQLRLTLTKGHSERKKYDYEEKIDHNLIIVGQFKEDKPNAIAALMEWPYSNYRPLLKGLINEKGDTLIPLKYDNIHLRPIWSRTSNFGGLSIQPKNLFLVQKGYNFGVINIHGKIIIPIEQSHIHFISGAILLEKWRDPVHQMDRQQAIYDFKGNPLIPYRNTGLSYGLLMDKWVKQEDLFLLQQR